MSKPTKVTLKKDEQKRILSEFKSGKSARVIATELKLPRYEVMYLLESKGLKTFSDGSYL